MMKTAVACGFLIAFASMGHAQSPATSNIAGQQARVDAQFKAWRTAVTQLLTRADIKALRLKPIEIEAFTAVIMDDDPVARVDLADIVRRMSMLHKDQDATFDIVETWIGMQQLHQNLAGAAAPERARLLTGLRAKHL